MPPVTTPAKREHADVALRPRSFSSPLGMTSALAIEPIEPSTLLHSLEWLGRAHPLARKRLVGPDVNFGRELLVTLARRTGGWLGWEATNLRGIAQSLAFLPLAERGVHVADDVTIDALANRALARAIEAGKVGRHFAALAPGLGFRRALLDTLLELRTAGISANELRTTVAPGSPAHELPAVLAEYEGLLEQEKLADPADVFRVAADFFDREAPFVLDGIVAVVPSRSLRGLPGALMNRLLANGAHLLAVDDVTPDRVFDARVSLDFFAAATPSDELREVCRRVVAEGLRWDDVEIVATDPDTYGIALDALSQRIGMGATMLKGIPLARTRIGRALDRWLAWLSDGLPADVLRQALEAGEVNVADTGVAPTALARELRSLRIGWGRARYESALARIESGKRVAEMKRREDESDEELAARRASRQRTESALATLLRVLLATTPPVPERGSDRPVRSSCAALAKATLGYLALSPEHGESEARTMERLRGRLTELAGVDDEPSSFSTALAALREALADLRAWPLVTSERKPWSAAGGMPHLTSVSHAGTTGRGRVFVVGFDADRTSGSGRQDPLLPDAARRAIGGGRLVTSVERREESARAIAVALASLRGRVTLSYATSGTLDGREAGPSPLMLQAWRQARADVSASYEELRSALRPPASAVLNREQDGAGTAMRPREGSGAQTPPRAGGGPVAALPLDRRDVWLDALADGALLLDGTSVVREAFPVLAAGLDAHDIANADALSAFHGLVPDAGPALDPTARPDREISPSSLETLAKCPLSWFYRYGLSLYPSQDPEYDEEHWLDSLQRGSLLHEVFETFTRAYLGRQDQLAHDEAARHMNDIAAAAVARWRDDVPPPAETVFEAERAEIHRAAASFVHMERERWADGDRGRWLAFELAFGRGEQAGSFTLPDGRTLLTLGFADRVDEMPDGTLRVIDYKTGKASYYAKSPKTGAFNGGRHLQPALYRAAVEALTGKTVSSFEYRFPTERGGNEIVAYTSEELAGVRDIVGSLIAHVHAGEFIATTDTGDCGFCDHQEICRASRGRFATSSPRAEWAKLHAEQLPQYSAMLVRRTPGGGA